MLKIISPDTGKKIRIADENIDAEMDWYQAVQACKNLGKNWRLPSITELEVIFEELHVKEKGGFTSGVYWSGNEGLYSKDDKEESAWLFKIITPYPRGGWPSIASGKHNLCFVRAVCDII